MIQVDDVLIAGENRLDRRGRIGRILELARHRIEVVRIDKVGTPGLKRRRGQVECVAQAKRFGNADHDHAEPTGTTDRVVAFAILVVPDFRPVEQHGRLEQAVQADVDQRAARR